MSQPPRPPPPFATGPPPPPGGPLPPNASMGPPPQGHLARPPFGMAPPPGAPLPPFGAPPPGLIPPPQPAMMGGIPLSKQTLNTKPSRTVYVSNLNEKVKLPVLKTTLKTMFSQFGEVLDVVAYSNIRMRGQAFVAYADEENAAKAIKELQHFTLYNKPMVVQYARNKSDVHAKRDGDFDDHFADRLKRKEARKSMPLPGANKKVLPPPQVGIPRPAGPIPQIPDEFLPPNNILFLQNLPETISQEQIEELFKAYSGFKEVRMIPTKKSIAFVEYETDIQSTAAKNGLANYTFGPDHPIRITFARK